MSKYDKSINEVKAYGSWMQQWEIDKIVDVLRRHYPSYGTRMIHEMVMIHKMDDEIPFREVAKIMGYKPDPKWIKQDAGGYDNGRYNKPVDKQVLQQFENERVLGQPKKLRRGDRFSTQRAERVARRKAEGKNG